MTTQQVTMAVLIACLLPFSAGCPRSISAGNQGDAAVPLDATDPDGGPTDGASPDASPDASSDAAIVCAPQGPLVTGFRLWLDGQDVDSWFQNMGFMRTADATVVQVIRPDSQVGYTEIALSYLDDGFEAVLRLTLPDQQHVPVYAGEIVEASVHAEAPWWVNKQASIRGQNGDLRVVVRNWDWTLADPPVDCTPAPFWCGEVVYPHAEITLVDPSLAGPSVVSLTQGEQTVVPGTDASFRVLLASAYVYTFMECYDVPLGNQTYAIVRLL